MSMALPRIKVDFNEIVEADLVLLGKTDDCLDDKGKVVSLFEGLKLQVFEADVDIDGKSSVQLVADGVCVLNTTATEWTKDVKWCFRIDGVGIRHEAWPEEQRRT